MNTTRKLTLSIAAFSIAVLALTGCTTGSASSEDAKELTDAAKTLEQISENAEQAEVEASQAAQDALEANGQDDRIIAFGEGWDYNDGIYYGVSAPQPFEPTEYAAGATFPNNIVVTVTVKNNSEQPFDVLAVNSVTSGGQAGSQIFDSGNPIGEIGSSSSSLLPGQEVSWLEAYSVADAADVTLTGAPSFVHTDVYWNATGE